MMGIIRWVSRNRDYCFVKPESGQDDLFLHVRDVNGNVIPEIDMTVSFEVITRGNRKRAVNAQPGPAPITSRYDDL